MNRPLSHRGWATAPDQAQPAPGALPSDIIQSQLDRILAGPQFRDSLRLTRFLSFVVETTLNGKAECIKAYTIATEALGRDSDFDPQNDPIVRVEAGRLRQALARYYAKHGHDDAVLIELPRGSYVPNFQRRSPASQQALDEDLPLASNSVASTPSAQQPTCTRELTASILSSVGAFRLQQEQMAELSAVMRSVSQTLHQSRELLKESAQMGFGGYPPAAENSHDVLGARARDDARVAAPPSQQPQPERPREPLSLRQVRSLAMRLTSRAGAKARIFKIAFAAIAVLAILEFVFDIDHPLVGGPDHGLWHRLWPATNAAASQAPGTEGAPVIYVEPVAAVGQEVAGLFPAKAIRERLINALARYDDVTVVTRDPGSTASRSGGAPDTQRLRPIYHLAATVRYSDESAMLIVQLVDATDNSIAWSRQYVRPVKPHPRAPKGRIAPDVARSLLDPFGVIQARERVTLAAVDPMKDTYRCILDANVYLRSFNPSQYQAAHDCLLHASEAYPHTTTVFADLAFVYLRNYRFGIGGPPGDPATLDDAYAMAARAADIRPDSPFAQYALAAVLLAKGDIARAKIASDESYRLNPDDGAVAFGHATMLILTGDVDAGLSLLDRNAAKTPNSWIGYRLLKALGCYLKGDVATAATEARQIANPFFPPGLMLDAVIADKAGDRARAQQDIAMLYQFYPAWQQNPGASIARFLPENAMAERIAADFKAAAADTMQ